ncbi:hypothetical protein, partial [Acetobacter sp.]|uniref:hypothetical protein n=1 Tax=Acetobacter sp. TaxID=440 RepID=UPI0039EA90DC
SGTMPTTPTPAPIAPPMPATGTTIKMATPMLCISMAERKMNSRQQQGQKTYLYRMYLLHSYAPTLAC